MDAAVCRLFVVNNDPQTRDAVRTLASSIGIQSESYSSAGDFLNCFTSSLAGCVIADLCVNGMSGLELQAALAARGSYSADHFSE